MSNTTDKISNATTSGYRTFRLVPFTGGIIIGVYAWFWPESYGHWLGTIVHSFRTAAGI